MKDMKSQLLRTLAIVLLLGASCSTESTDFDNTGDSSGSGNIVDVNSVGYLSFESAQLSVDADMEGFLDEEEATSTIDTRSDSSSVVELDDYIVQLTKESDGSIVEEWSYSAIKSLVDPLEYDAGYYVIKAFSERSIPASQWNHEIYTSTSSKLTVGDNNVTTVPAIVCTLATIKAQVSVSADMKELFDVDDPDMPLTVTLSLGEESVDFSVDIMDNEDAIYFAPQSDNTTLNVTLTGMFNSADVGEEPAYVPLTWTNEINNVAAGQWRKISIKVDNYHEGQIQIGCTVEGWTTDATLGVEVMSTIFNIAMAEDIIPELDDESSDKDAPVLSLSNMSVSDTYYITSSIFDLDAEVYYPTYKATLTPEGDSTVESVYIVVESTNESLLTKMNSDGYTDGKIVLWGDGAVSTPYITMRQDGSLLYGTLTYSGAMMLSGYSGTHTISVVAVDSESRRSFTKLTIDVTSSGSTAPPTITWDGGDFDEDLNIDVIPSGGLSVVINVASTATGGLTNLYLDIVSEVLPEEDLDGMGIYSGLDVANVDIDSNTYESLTKLEIPCGDAVLGQSNVVIDISRFMALIQGLGVGETTFTIKAVDANGECEVVLNVVRTK